MNHVIPHCLFYHIMYQIMDDCFFLLVFIYFVYGFFFPKKGAGLHPSVFFFITESCVPSFSLLPFSLTSHNMAKSWAFLLHDSSLSPSSSKPINSHHIPSRDQKGTPAVQIPFLIQEPQCWSYSATWNWTCVLSRFWIQIPQPPHLVWSYIVCPDEPELKGDPVCGCTVIVFTLWEGWGLREGEGKRCISYWSSARRMGVLYNVELVSCVLWCKNDGNELLFLFYDLTVSVTWITAIYSESKFVCIIMTHQDR